MISGASDEELEIMNARAKVLSICGTEVLEILDKTNEEYEKKLKSAINELNWDVDKLSRGLAKKEREIDRLNNIINQLEKYLEEFDFNAYICGNRNASKSIELGARLNNDFILDKLKELKEENK